MATLETFRKAFDELNKINLPESTELEKTKRKVHTLGVSYA